MVNEDMAKLIETFRYNAHPVGMLVSSASGSAYRATFSLGERTSNFSELQAGELLERILGAQAAYSVYS